MTDGTIKHHHHRPSILHSATAEGIPNRDVKLGHLSKILQCENWTLEMLLNGISNDLWVLAVAVVVVVVVVQVDVTASILSLLLLFILILNLNYCLQFQFFLVYGSKERLDFECVFFASICFFLSFLFAFSSDLNSWRRRPVWCPSTLNNSIELVENNNCNKECLR